MLPTLLLPLIYWVPWSVLTPKAASSILPQHSQPACWLQWDSFLQSCQLSSAVPLLLCIELSQPVNHRIISILLKQLLGLICHWLGQDPITCVSQGLSSLGLIVLSALQKIVSTSVTTAGSEGGKGVAQNIRHVSSLGHGGGPQGCDSVPEKKILFSRSIFPIPQDLASTAENCPLRDLYFSLPGQLVCGLLFHQKLSKKYSAWA